MNISKTSFSGVPQFVFSNAIFGRRLFFRSFFLSPQGGSPYCYSNKSAKSVFSERSLTTQKMESEMAMDLCIDRKDEERESEAQSVVRAKKRAPRPPPPPTPPRARFFALLGLALSLFISLVDAKVHSHLTFHVSCLAL